MIGTTRASVGQTLEREQLIRRNIDEVFEFFGDPANLEDITPPWLHFRMTACTPPVIEQGTLIDYRLRVRGVPVRWRSLISLWEPPFQFVDEQLIGPYRRWFHHHSFTQCEDGVLVRDRIEYSVPGGALIDRLFVRGDLARIFDYRAEQLATLLADRL